MPTITIQGTVINFPDSGEQANWSEAVIQFAELTAAALQGAVGDFDIPPQFSALSSNANTDLEIPNLQFSTSEVRGAEVRYAHYRQTDSNKTFGYGKLFLIYDGSDWYIQREEVGNVTDEVLFEITASGQLTITTTTLAGSNYVGGISYAGIALLQSS